MSNAETTDPKVLLGHHLKKLKLPTFLAEYDKIARPGSHRLPIR